MNEQRLTRRQLLWIALTGLATGLVALAVTSYLVGSAEPLYRAQAQVALVPAPTVPAEEVPSYWEALGGGQAASIAAQVLQQPQWAEQAAQTAGVAPADLTVTAGVVDATSLIDVTAETTSPEAAESALDALITAATPTVQRVSGPYALDFVQSAVGSAQPAGVSATQLLIVVFAGGLLIGSGIALLVTRARRRPEDSAPALADDDWSAIPERVDYGSVRGPVDDPVTSRYPSAR
ncbi:hypothetical protein [Pseudonocardia hydrocarbonoxydans]|uniref:Polysaccharide chain length determinant N-terminal domain-containing protein n=1 Tax=Pseudonocardia hydrocarbonoxydans TaxID=76726 RepID=A0A4Y3WM57_9PSEU|nr:hypothetical protein [Pseudonocardia hydrocarbonoxydans]GEC19140.1 hypothetical protein PHY01_14230 [Pseudonocardia hydrocarbonoxydans]